MVDHIPDGFHALTPYLHVDDANGFIEWTKQALGAEVRMVHTVEDAVVHAEILIEGCVMELSEGRKDWPARPSAFHLYVPDPDTAVKRALEAGGEELHPMMDQEYGERSGAVRDPWGNDWYIARVTDHEVRSP